MQIVREFAIKTTLSLWYGADVISGALISGKRMSL
jgi:hypothetical protein